MAGRIIPAYAGSTCRAVRMIRKRKDHPRVCGEHDLFQHSFQQTQGSSPRMRGAPIILSLFRQLVRIIPAYAGSTGIRSRKLWGEEDHPRVCGEHRLARLRVAARWGSSPRMRGALSRMSAAWAFLRIIPAYAGSTPGYTGELVFSRDHPRVCGEHEFEGKTMTIVGGSSPRMRGARLAVGRAA